MTHTTFALRAPSPRGSIREIPHEQWDRAASVVVRRRPS
jgi:hypothetical protein